MTIFKATTVVLATRAATVIAYGVRTDIRCPGAFGWTRQPAAKAVAIATSSCADVATEIKARASGTDGWVDPNSAGVYTLLEKDGYGQRRDEWKDELMDDGIRDSSKTKNQGNADGTGQYWVAGANTVLNEDGTWQVQNKAAPIPDVVIETKRMSNPNSAISTGRSAQSLDRQIFTLKEQNGNCRIEACSMSEVIVANDYSTNYCNLRNLYCAGSEGCTPVRKEFSVTETVVETASGAGKDKRACIHRVNVGGRMRKMKLKAQQANHREESQVKFSKFDDHYSVGRKEKYVNLDPTSLNHQYHQVVV